MQPPKLRSKHYCRILIWLLAYTHLAFVLSQKNSSYFRSFLSSLLNFGLAGHVAFVYVWFLRDIITIVKVQLLEHI